MNTPIVYWSNIDLRQTEEALAECPYCWHDGNRPLVTVVSLGVKVALAIPQTIPMLPFHCLIVPTQHVTSTLDLEDDAWDEIRVQESNLELPKVLDEDDACAGQGCDIHGASDKLQMAPTRRN
jgi:Protein similar to CwfJ C-terminus 1